MPVEINTSNAFGNPTKGSLFDTTEQSFQSADVVGLGSTAYQNLLLENGNIAGKDTLVFTDAQWGNLPLQTSFMGIGKISIIEPISTFGITVTSSGNTTPALSSSSLQTRSKSTQYSTGTSVSGTAGVYTTYNQWWRGGTTGEGGFFFDTVFSQNTNVSGHSVFLGLCTSTSSLSGSPSALLNIVGVGYDVADSAAGNWYVMTNDASGTATKYDTGTPRDTTSVLEFSAYCKGASGGITCRLLNKSTSSVVYKTTTYTSDLPISTSFLAFKSEISNNSTTSDGTLLLYKTYIQTPE
jgi:hypothetical protein